MPSQGAALGCMVGLMSYGKRQFEELDPIMRKLIPPFHQAMDELVAMVDADSRAFSSYMVRSHRWWMSHGEVGGLGREGWHRCTLVSLGEGLGPWPKPEPGEGTSSPKGGLQEHQSYWVCPGPSARHVGSWSKW